jgi:hypothetical protein
MNETEYEILNTIKEPISSEKNRGKSLPQKLMLLFYESDFEKLREIIWSNE